MGIIRVSIIRVICLRESRFRVRCGVSLAVSVISGARLRPRWTRIGGVVKSTVIGRVCGRLIGRIVLVRISITRVFLAISIIVCRRVVSGTRFRNRWHLIWILNPTTRVWGTEIYTFLIACILLGWKIVIILATIITWFLVSWLAV
ncbi:hypothetical protein ABW19_dt0201685 [Dactylella cylindrospora]|nr:hypothetical protein ABW19_dt0201685 [Dactylella cylindrospora]